MADPFQDTPAPPPGAGQTEEIGAGFGPGRGFEASTDPATTGAEPPMGFDPSVVIGDTSGLDDVATASGDAAPQPGVARAAGGPAGPIAPPQGANVDPDFDFGAPGGLSAGSGGGGGGASSAYGPGISTESRATDPGVDEQIETPDEPPSLDLDTEGAGGGDPLGFPKDDSSDGGGFLGDVVEAVTEFIDGVAEDLGDIVD